MHNTIRSSVLRLLSNREHSAAELLQKLLAKKFSREEIHPVLTALAHEGLLNEKRFVENFIHYRRTRGFGPLRIRAELIERGITEELIEQELDIADNAWFTEIRRVFQKRFKNQIASDYKAHAQQMRFLQHRGFTHDQIKTIFSEKND